MAEQQSIKPIYGYRDWEIDLAHRELRLKGAKIALGNRAFEVIEVLVEAEGRTVDKYDIMGRLWPGAVVEENTLQFHISALRKALGPDRELLRTEFGRGYRLLGKWEASKGKEQGVPARPVPEATESSRYSSNLPASVSELIGRGAALSKIRNLLVTSRIITLSGLGGIGKTTLALEAAREFADDFEGDTALVELASVSDPNLVSSVVATSLGLRLGGYQITPLSIAQAIGTRRVLLLLDNCEHLVDAAAQFAETLVRLCPQACILATSREPLRIQGEKVFQVPPLDVPAPDDGATDFLDHSAIKLFIARSGEQINSSLRDESLPTIATICQRLDGIPLAIEFAAARAETLGVLHVAERLHDRFTLLAGTRRTALPRQQTLRATLDWSYELLPESEQYLFRHLAIFPGGFTVAAAEAMAGDKDGSSLEERISSLVWKSLISLVHSADEPRWRLLETTRAYGLEKLAENGERAAAAGRQARFLCQQFALSADAPRVTMDALPRFIGELDNVRAALDWAFSEVGDPSTGVALAAAYAPAWLHLGLITECRDRLGQARDRLRETPDLPPWLKSQLLTVLGLAENYTGVADETTRSGLMWAQEIADGSHDDESHLQALYASWSHDFIRGNISSSIEFAERMADIGIRRGNAADVKFAQRLLGSSYHYFGDQNRALSCFESALGPDIPADRHRAAFWFHLGGQSFPRTRLARTIWMRGFVQRSLELAMETFDEAQARHHKFSMCVTLAEALCPLYLLSGNLSEAGYYIAMLSELAEGSIFGGFADYLQGSLLIKSGDHAEGLRLLRAALERSGSMAGKEGRTSIIIDFTTPQGSGFLLNYAEALVGLRNFDDAAEMIETAISQAHQEGLLWHVPELLRLKGELLSCLKDAASHMEAEEAFREAIEISRRQGAIYWQLRATISLFRLQMKEGNGNDARALLTTVCDAYAAEPLFLDLETARKLLDSR